MGDNTLFFYGTLTAPSILHRVIHGPSNPTFPTPASSYVRTRPALLHRHRRHRVRGADYPAVVPDSSTGASVRGTLATNLTDADVRRLDIFEGDEYERRKVRVVKLVSNAEDTAREEQSMRRSSEDEEEMDAETYIWIAGGHRLEEAEWDFETFKREKMRFWIGSDGSEGETGREEFGAVDRQDGTGGRGVDGDIGRQLAEHQKGTAEPVGSGAVRAAV